MARARLKRLCIAALAVTVLAFGSEAIDQFLRSDPESALIAKLIANSTAFPQDLTVSATAKPQLPDVFPQDESTLPIGVPKRGQDLPSTLKICVPKVDASTLPASGLYTPEDVLRVLQVQPQEGGPFIDVDTDESGFLTRLAVRTEVGFLSCVREDQNLSCECDLYL